MTDWRVAWLEIKSSWRGIANQAWRLAILIAACVVAWSILTLTASELTLTWMTP
jgi:hypothetical protein